MPELADLIDHTLLAPDAAETHIKKLCDEAIQHGFFSVCVQPCHVAMAKQLLSGTDRKVPTVIGFPLGMSTSKVKIFESMEAVLLGADELDIVINLGAAVEGRWNAVKKEISDIVTATPDVIHKIIIETYYLTKHQKISAALTALESGAEFIKTSTGFAPAGATVGDVGMLRNAVKGQMGIKAAGGIKTLKDVLNFIEAGATRIGTSSGVNIMKEAR